MKKTSILRWYAVGFQDDHCRPFMVAAPTKHLAKRAAKLIGEYLEVEVEQITIAPGHLKPKKKTTKI